MADTWHSVQAAKPSFAQDVTQMIARTAVDMSVPAT